MGYVLSKGKAKPNSHTKATTSHTSVSGPPPACIPHARNDTWALYRWKTSVHCSVQWWVYVCGCDADLAPARRVFWTFRTRNRSTTWSGLKLIYSSFSSQFNKIIIKGQNDQVHIICLVYKYHQISLLWQWWTRKACQDRKGSGLTLTEIRNKKGEREINNLWKCKSLTLFYTYTYVPVNSY